MHRHLRIARPVSDLASSTHMYCRGLGLRVIASFQGHAGFDGVMLGTAGADYKARSPARIRRIAGTA